jgi:hypothetical protein
MSGKKIIYAVKHAFLFHFILIAASSLCPSVASINSAHFTVGISNLLACRHAWPALMAPWIQQLLAGCTIVTRSAAVCRMLPVCVPASAHLPAACGGSTAVGLHYKTGLFITSSLHGFNTSTRHRRTSHESVEYKTRNQPMTRLK